MTYENFYNMTIADLIRSQAQQHANRTFLRSNDQTWTYAEIDRLAAALAAGLIDFGLRSGDRLAIILPNVAEYVISIFAVAKAGLIVVPINVRRSKAEVHTRLSKTGAAALITDRSAVGPGNIDHLTLAHELQINLSELKHIIAINGDIGAALSWKQLCTSNAALPLSNIKPADPAAIVHTLGNGGEPRGAVLTHGGLVHNAATIAANLACTPDDVFLGAVPFSNSFGLAPTILACAVAGAQLAMLPAYHPGEALNVIEQAQVTIHHGVPTMFALELNHPDFRSAACASLRTGVISGAHCPPELAARVRDQMHCNISLAYGLTEASPGVTMTHLDDGPITATQTVGRPLEGVALKVIDQAGSTLPDGSEGELCVRGYNVMKGYWNDPKLTAQVIDAEGWLHTGDLAVIDPDGPVKIAGRKVEVINRGGFKIYPGTIEMVLRSYPGVKEAAVVGVPDVIFGELPIACVVRAPGTDFKADQLLAFAAQNLTDYAVPDRVVFFDALPRRGSGPVQKDILRERIRIRGHVWKFGKNIDTD